jgi:hypothetical protein
MKYVGNHIWARAFEVDGVSIGFLAADHVHPMSRGYIYQPLIAPENMLYLPAMMRQAGDWMESIGLQSAKIEVPDQLAELGSCLLNNGWNKRYTWIYLVKWLDEKARQEFAFGV